MVINTSIIYESLVTLVLLLLMLASTRGSFGTVCPSLGNWGSSKSNRFRPSFWKVRPCSPWGLCIWFEVGDSDEMVLIEPTNVPIPEMIVDFLDGLKFEVSHRGARMEKV